MKKENNSKNVRKKLNDLLVSFLLGVFANIRNLLYIYSTTLSAYLFYQAMQKDIVYCYPVLGFLFISYLPIFYRKNQ